MRIVNLLALSLAFLSCKKDSTPIPVNFASTQLGTRVTATLTTTPGQIVKLLVKPERGTVGDPGKAEEWRYSTEAGAAEFLLDGPEGENSISVTATDEKGQRKTAHTFKFTVKAPVVPVKPEVIEVSDATDNPGGSVVNCDGAFDTEPGLTTIGVCTGGWRLATDSSVGFKIKARLGKKVTLGDKSFDFKDGVAEARLDLMPLVAALDLGMLGEERPLSVPMTLELADGTRKTNLALGAGAAWDFFEKAGKGPLLFPGEKPGAGGKASMVAPAYRSSYGTCETVADVDLVAQLTSVPRKASPCVYGSSDSAEKKTIPRSGEDLTAIVYDRRSGKQIAKKSFSAPVPSCAAYVVASDKDGRNGSVDKDAVEKWLETLVTKPPEP